MKFRVVLWGAGYRAQHLISFLPRDMVVAVIDSNPHKVGQLICNKPIINFATFEREYRDFCIVITPAEYHSIEKYLISKGVFNYFILSECPSEFVGYGIDKCSKVMEQIPRLQNNSCIIGSNLYSVLLYLYMREIGCNGLKMFANENRNIKTIDALKEIFEIDFCDQNFEVEKYYITTRQTNGIKVNKEYMDIYDLSFEIKEYINPELLKFKNINFNESCFIVATGPSLLMSDLDKIQASGIKSFSVNRIFNLTDSKWRPNYYVSTDRYAVQQYQTEIYDYNVPYKFINEHGISIDKKEDIFKIHVVVGDTLDIEPKFSEDISRVVYGGATVVYACIQIAIYMGFKKIYLLGTDCNYIMGSSTNYCFKENKEDNLNHHVDMMVLSYIAAKKYAENHGVKIYNATRGGMLEVFERVDFDSLFDKDSE